GIRFGLTAHRIHQLEAQCISGLWAALRDPDRMRKAATATQRKLRIDEVFGPRGRFINAMLDAEDQWKPSPQLLERYLHLLDRVVETSLTAKQRALLDKRY